MIVGGSENEIKKAKGEVGYVAVEFGSECKVSYAVGDIGYWEVEGRGERKMGEEAKRGQ